MIINWSELTNPFLLVMFIFPVLTIIFSLVFYELTKKKLLTTGVVFVFFGILTFSVFNKTFIPWVIIYSVFSLVTVFFIEKINNNFIRDNNESRRNKK